MASYTDSSPCAYEQAYGKLVGAATLVKEIFQSREIGIDLGKAAVHPLVELGVLYSRTST